MTPEGQRRDNVRHATNIRLRRWGVRPALCQVCEEPREEALTCHHPSYEGRWASWHVIVVHPSCRRRGGGALARQFPSAVLDLRDLDVESPGPWFTRVDIDGG